MFRSRSFTIFASSIGEITDKAGVNRTTYYRHFASKEHIIKYYYAGVLSEYLDTLDLSGGVGLEQYLLGMFAHLEKYKKQLLLIYQNGVSHLILDALNELFLQNQLPLSFDVEFADTLPHRWHLRHLSSLIFT